MTFQYKRAARLAALVAVACGMAHAQFQVAGRKVDIHGFFQQGFAWSDQNNYLTMQTSRGSAAMTDGGVNISSQLFDRFRVGAQIYSRNIGDLGNGKVEVDWAMADYRWKDWLGVRGGKVKTALGLYNETQDMEFLHTFALLPQSVYPTDLRSNTIAHVGGDVYGAIPLKKAGTVNYTLYAGLLPDDRRGGYRYGTRDGGFNIKGGMTLWAKGFDVKWATPVEGLQAGLSWMGTGAYFSGTIQPLPYLPIRIDMTDWHTHAAYAEYQKNGLKLSGEWRSSYTALRSSPLPLDFDVPSVGWFVAGSYRFTNWLEVGSYFSRYISNTTKPATANNKISGPAVTARFDLNRYMNLKVEQHFMDGYGSPLSAHGFYPSSNPQGLQPRTNLFLTRLGFSY